jgi:hypothetical protein
VLIFAALRKASEEFDTRQGLYDFKAMDRIITDSIAPQRFTTTLLGVFSLIALILSGTRI